MLPFLEVHNRDPRLVHLTWSFNDLGGSNGNILIRNLLVISFYDSAAIVISCGKGCQLAPTGYQWIALIGLILMTTIQVQQRCDLKSDVARRQKRIPLVLGDGFMRWTIEAGVMGWSIGAPTFRKADIKAYALPLRAGETLSYWYMRCRKSMCTCIVYMIEMVTIVISSLKNFSHHRICILIFHVLHEEHPVPILLWGFDRCSIFVMRVLLQISEHNYSGSPLK